MVEELRVKAMKELDGFEKYGESVAPLLIEVLGLMVQVNNGFLLVISGFAHQYLRMRMVRNECQPRFISISLLLWLLHVTSHTFFTFFFVSPN